MKVPSPIVTLLVGVLIAVVVAVLSVRAHESAQKPYGSAVAAAVLR